MEIEWEPYSSTVSVSLTVMILSFQTDWSGQIVQTQIRLLLEEQSDPDQGHHYLQYYLQLWMHISMVKPLFLAHLSQRLMVSL